MPLIPFDEVLAPDKLAEGRVKLNTSLELLRIFVNSLESYLNGLTPEQVGDLIVAGKINPTYLEAFLTSVDASMVTFTSTEAGFTSTDVEAALDYLYTTLTGASFSASEISVLDSGNNFAGNNVEAVLIELNDAIESITVPAGYPATSISIADTDNYYTSANVEGALKEAYEAIGSSGGGSPYITDDGRTTGFTLPTVAGTALGSVAIGSAIQVLDTSADNTAVGRNHVVSETSDSTVGGVGLAPYLVYGSSMFGNFSSIENVDTSFFWGNSGYFGATLPGLQTSYSDIVMGDGVYAFDAYDSLAIGSGSTIDTVDSSMAVGPFSEILTSNGATALGPNSSINTSNNSIAIGFQAGVNTAEGAISMGWGAVVDQSSTSSIGIAPGYGLVRNSTDAVGVGRVVDLQNSNSGVSIGSYTHLRDSANGVVLGTLAEVRNSSDSVAIGANAYVNYSDSSIAVTSDGGFGRITGLVGNVGFANSLFGGDSSEVVTSSYSTVIGSATGVVTDSYLGAIISSEGSTVTNANGYGMIVSGVSNNIENVGNNNAIFGGSNNSITTSSDHGFILGGSYNQISGDAWFRSILGGESNVIDRPNVEYVGISPASRASYARRDVEFVISGYNSVNADLNRTGTPNTVRTGGKASSMQMLVRTTDATPTYLRLDTSDHVPLLDRTVTGFKVYLVATNFDEAADESAYWEITFATDVREGVGRLLGTPIINEIHKDVPAWDVSIDVETITPAPVDPLANFANARIQVTGEAAKNITWTARVDISELDF